MIYEGLWDGSVWIEKRVMLRRIKWMREGLVRDLPDQSTGKKKSQALSLAFGVGSNMDGKCHRGSPRESLHG
jgi:hypothetical protein